MLELQNNELVFRFPEVHANAELRINLQRTLRIPDDGKTYPLPPGLGTFPVLHIDDYKERVPATWREHGGVFLPMFQAEAAWICFARRSVNGDPIYPFAVRVAAGKINAVTGDGWSDTMVPGDHMVSPPQPWLDGFAVEKGKIRQFVAAPLGMGLTVEQQLTGKEEHGGIQIEVRPLKAAEYQKLVDRERERERHARELKTRVGVLRGVSRGMALGSNAVFGALIGTNGIGHYHRNVTYNTCSASSLSDAPIEAAGMEMGLGAGGLMVQQIFEDSFPIDAWDSAKSRVFLHLANSQAWQAITGLYPPPTPCTVEAYAARGLPWFDFYADAPVADGGKNLKQVKTVKAMAAAKGVPFLPSNQSVEVPADKVVKLGKPAVRDGNW